MVSAVGVSGFEPSEEGDPFVIAVAGPFDAPVAVGPLNKDRREDLQLWSFLFALGLTTGGPHPLTVSCPSSDPPDRVLTCEAHTWGVELTELTVFDVRVDFARARALGRELQDFLNANTAEYGHLLGRRVSVSVLPVADPGAGADVANSMRLVREALTEDRGFVGEGLDLTAGPPPVLPPSGMYGQFGQLNGVVHAGGAADQIVVAASANGRVYRSQALTALNARIREKDIAGNDCLLITCGQPDERGFSCPLDAFIFALLADASRDGGLDITMPAHLRGIAVHLWPTNEWIEAYREPDTPMPWT